MFVNCQTVRDSDTVCAVVAVDGDKLFYYDYLLFSESSGPMMNEVVIAVTATINLNHLSHICISLLLKPINKKLQH